MVNKISVRNYAHTDSIFILNATLEPNIHRDGSLNIEFIGNINCNNDTDMRVGNIPTFHAAKKEYNRNLKHYVYRSIEEEF